MAEFDSKPVTNLSELRKGDPVLLKNSMSEESYGFVVRKKKPFVGIWNFAEGYPLYSERRPEIGTIRKVTTEEVIEHFESVTLPQLSEKVSKGTLEGVWSSRYKADLESLIMCLGESKNREENYRALLQYHDHPQTGIFVLCGVYAGYGQSQKYESVVTAPWLTNYQVSKLVSRLVPDGFRDIPDHLGINHSLVGYFATEVPHEATKFIVNPATLRVDNLTAVFSFRTTENNNLRKYSVTEEFSKKSLSLLLKNPNPRH